MKTNSIFYGVCNVITTIALCFLFIDIFNCWNGDSYVEELPFVITLAVFMLVLYLVSLVLVIRNLFRR